MPSYDHDKLLERIARLDTPPKDSAKYAAWIKAGEHMGLLRDTAYDDELIIYASGDYTFTNAVVVSEDSLSPLDQDDLLHWNGNPYSSCADYTSGGGRDDVWIERDGPIWGSKALKDARLLVFGREFEGLLGSDRMYFEILQEYSHLSGIHWRPELHAYCRFDEHGDWEQVVSVTSKAKRGDVALVSFKREELEQYLAASNSVLIRMFDFAFFRHSEFTQWPDGPENVVRESEDFFYRQKVDAEKAAYTRGVQIIRPTRPKSMIFSSIKDGRTVRKDREYCEFIALDWRNKRVASISTNPEVTTSYFDAPRNSLPYEVSPAFFRPEVLSKYKADREKYTINEEHRFISCRGGWELKTYDINEAGQVHTYICYLRALPYQEQLYWKSFNEKPKAGISERALLNDIRGEWTEITHPLEDILLIMRQWSESNVTWWKLREETLLERANTPRTGSRDEWAQAFMDLSKLVIEGFEIKAIRTKLNEMQIGFNKEDKSLALIEKAFTGSRAPADESKLDGLKRVQAIRSTIAAHSSGSLAAELELDALNKHGTFSAHFDSVCRNVIDELKVIEETFSE